MMEKKPGGNRLIPEKPEQNRDRRDEPADASKSLTLTVLSVDHYDFLLATVSARRRVLVRLVERIRTIRGQALLETVMATGFLVAIAVVLNELLGPVILDAFEKIALKLSSVGP
jgi:hypothetical protein